VKQERCPFTDRTYSLDVDTPCPVCGELGRADSEVKCIDYPEQHTKRELSKENQ